MKPGKLLRIYVSEHDQYNGRPLYKAIVSKCQELELAGATVFRGLEGFGHAAELHRPHLFAHDQPIVITIVETPEKSAQALPVLQAMMKTGVIAITDVEMMVISNR
jgi:PII-like signaling protein